MNSAKANADDDRGVSEMTAVVTLVAIAFVLVAGVGAGAFLFSGDDTGPPKANFTYRYLDSASALVVTHEQGDPVRAGDLYVEGRDANASWAALAGWNASAMVEPGATVMVSKQSAFDAQVDSTDRIRIVWRNATVNGTAVLSRWSGEDAI
ncbi:MAG: type IV pilin [Halorhabdus sp.]